MKKKSDGGDFFKAFPSGELSPVYLFYGGDVRKVERAARAVEERVLGEGVPEFNADYFYGKEADLSSVAAAARTMPMMSSRRLVVMKRVEQIKASSLGPLLDYLGSPNPSTVLVLTAGELAGKKKSEEGPGSKLIQASRKAGQVVNFPSPRRNQLPALVQETARELKKKIEPSAVQLLIELAGEDPLNLEQELQKAALLTDDRKTITRDDVLESLADVKEFTVFEFTDAIGDRDVHKSLLSYRKLRESKQEPLAILAMLARHFRIIWSLQERVERGEAPPLIAKQTGLNEWVMKNAYFPRLKKFKPADTGRIMSALAELDLKLKSLTVEKDLLFERTLLKLCLGRF